MVGLSGAVGLFKKKESTSAGSCSCLLVAGLVFTAVTACESAVPVHLVVLPYASLLQVGLIIFLQTEKKQASPASSSGSPSTAQQLVLSRRLPTWHS